MESEICNKISTLKQSISNQITLVAVSKTKPSGQILEAYNCRQIHFGENKVQELTQKFEVLPKDIKWHFIGHLQTNKVKYIAPFVYLIHGVDSEKLLNEINKRGKNLNRKISVLIQVFIAQEETKFGFSPDEVLALFSKNLIQLYPFVNIVGLMGMATFTDNKTQINNEFKTLQNLYNQLKKQGVLLNTLSMGMTNDYEIALQNGSNMIRIGSALFGERNY